MKVTSREKIIMVIAFVFLAGLIFYNLFYEPLKNEISDLEANISDKQLIYTTLLNRQNEYNSVSANIKDAEDQLNAAEKMFPSEWDDTYMLTLIEEVVGDLAVKQSLTVSPLVNKNDYYIGTYVLGLKGYYSNIYEILTRFENLRYFNTITSIEFSDFYDTQEMNVQITVHFYTLDK